jgi:hypothetical protein
MLAGMRRLLSTFGLAATIACTPGSLLASDDCEDCGGRFSFGALRWDPAFYAGASLQYGEFKDWSLSRIDSGTFTARDGDDRDSGFRLLGGIEFLQHFAAELSYVDFGGATFAGQSDGSGTFWEPGPQRDMIELDGYALHLIAKVPLGGDLAFAGRAGWWRWEARQRTSGTFNDAGTPTPFVLDLVDTGARFAWGAGFDYDGLRPFRLSLEFGVASFEAPVSQPLFGTSEVQSLGASVKYLF